MATKTIRNFIEKNKYERDKDAEKLVSWTNEIWKSPDHRIVLSRVEDLSYSNSGKPWNVHVDNDHFESIGWIELDDDASKLVEFLKLCDYE